MVLTTLIYMEKTLKTFVMQYIHLSVDIQLHHISCLVQWSDPYRWTSLVLHPVMMHMLMSFLGCIGTLMNASDVDMLLTAAFGGVAGIITGKSWTNALRACRLSTTVLLLDFFQNGAKTYHELNEYTWRLWVECQSHSPNLAVTAYTEIQRLPTPAGQPRGHEPHFFAAGHMNYACYMTWYLRNVENLPTAAKNDLTKGAHV